MQRVEVTQAVRAVLGGDYPVIRWVVEEYGGVDEFAVMADLKVEAARAKLAAGLDTLMDHLGGYQAMAGEE